MTPDPIPILPALPACPGLACPLALVLCFVCACTRYYLPACLPCILVLTVGCCCYLYPGFPSRADTLARPPPLPLSLICRLLPFGTWNIAACLPARHCGAQPCPRPCPLLQPLALPGSVRSLCLGFGRARWLLLQTCRSWWWCGWVHLTIRWVVSNCPMLPPVNARACCCLLWVLDGA